MKKYSVGEIPPFKGSEKKGSGGNCGSMKSKKSKSKEKRRTLTRSTILEEIKFKTSNDSDEVVSVIVTTHSGSSSYDRLFQSVPQKSPDGRVEVYKLANSGITKMIEVLKGEYKGVLDPTMQKFLKQIEELDSDSVLFNWECCSGCSDRGFSNDDTIELVDLILKRGHVVMFGDFSLKALITGWKEERFGPNPFINLGTCDKSIQLGFNAEKLKECGIPQLEVVGKLSDKGTCAIKCMSGTLVFGIDWQKAVSSQKYKLEVLTVCSKVDGRLSTQKFVGHPECLCESGEHRGPVGHAVLKFGEGQGEMMVSSGHWIELTKLSTSIETVEEYVRESFGRNTEYEEDIEIIRSPLTPQAERDRRMRNLSGMMVQQSPSCRSSRRNTN